MKKLYLSCALAMFAFGGTGYAQSPCGTDEMRKEVLKQHPELLQFEAELEKQIQAGMRRIDFKRAAKTTFVDQSDNPDFWYDIPIVVHIVHDYNTYSTSTFTGDFIPDNFIFEAVKEWNIVFAKQNADTIDVIPPFKKWVGNPRIRLHLATVDPNGNPTKGITRRRSYLTYDGGQQAKFDDWSPSSYVNIWFINKMSAGSGAAAYAHYPSTAAFIPFYDGVISLAEYMNKGSKTIPHEIGHVFNLSHVWGDNNDPSLGCGDDNVDDTPPTKGHSPSGCTAANLYDTSCSMNYFKLYTDSLGNIELVNYPDTNNGQNIMDYTYCDRMFTKGQARRMHLALNSDVAGRNRLWDTANLVATGSFQPMPDLKPIPDYSVTNIIGGTSYLSKNANFTFPDKEIKFTNFSHNDTVTAMKWVFNDAATPASTTLSSFNHSFTVPGWVKLALTATGNHSGDSTITFNKAVFVADNTGTPAAGYYQEFKPESDRDKWPNFNYYNNEFQWELANVGTYDNNSIMYRGYDARVTPTASQLTGTPKGDYDDFYSTPMDLTGMGTTCNLNFFFSGASRTATSSNINDSLYIDYTVNKGTSWVSVAKLGKGELFNKGVLSTPYTPAGTWDWAPKTLPLPAAAITNYTTFRFRMRPGTNPFGVSTGNNFYMDRIHFSPWPAEVSMVQSGNASVKVVPNPTMGDAYVVVNDAANTDAEISVSDITGKVVYSTKEAIKGSQARILIPASAVSVKGIYLIQTLTGSQVNTQKLVVY
jgi:hypothetical protein